MGVWCTVFRRELERKPRRLSDMKRFAVLLALMLAGCSGGGHSASRPTTAPTSAAAKIPLSAQLVLPSTTMTAGSIQNGKVVVQNNTGHALTVTGCRYLFQVRLVNASVRQEDPAWPQCAEALTIPIGASRYSVSVSAAYDPCTGPGGVCSAGPVEPLPPGEYQATLLQNPTVVPAPAPMTIRVTA